MGLRLPCCCHRRRLCFACAGTWSRPAARHVDVVVHTAGPSHLVAMIARRRDPARRLTTQPRRVGAMCLRTPARTLTRTKRAHRTRAPNAPRTEPNARALPPGRLSPRMRRGHARRPRPTPAPPQPPRCPLAGGLRPVRALGLCLPPTCASRPPARPPPPLPGAVALARGTAVCLCAGARSCRRAAAPPHFHPPHARRPTARTHVRTHTVSPEPRTREAGGMVP